MLRKNMLCRFWMCSIHLPHAVYAKLFECELILNVYYSEEQNGTEAKNSNYCIISSRDASTYVKVQGIKRFRAVYHRLSVSP